MNTQDFEKEQGFIKFKSYCEKEGIDWVHVLTESIKNAVQNFIKKKDPWDGVEFAECIDFEHSAGKTNGLLTFGKIYRVSNIVNGSEDCHIINDENYEGNCYLCILKPSTEAAYIEQLKKEAFERFGEIKEGDRFDRSSISLAYTTITVPYNKQFKGAGFKYWENRDSLEFDGVTIYRSGKWATRVKERVDVDFVWSEKKLLGKKMPVVAFHDKGKYGSAEAIVESVFKGKDDLEIANAFRFLAKQLEEYLNKE